MRSLNLIKRTIRPMIRLYGCRNDWSASEVASLNAEISLKKRHKQLEIYFCMSGSLLHKLTNSKKLNQQDSQDLTQVLSVYKQHREEELKEQLVTKTKQLKELQQKQKYYSEQVEETTKATQRVTLVEQELADLKTRLTQDFLDRNAI